VRDVLNSHFRVNENVWSNTHTHTQTYTYSVRLGSFGKDLLSIQNQYYETQIGDLPI